MIIYADLHIHSLYSRATSKNMVISTIASQSKRKGLDLVGTGDAFHPEWLQIIEDSTKPSKTGIYSVKGDDDFQTRLINSVDHLETETGYCKFILTAEVEDRNRVHQLIILPSVESAYKIREELPSKNIDKEGRPRVDMNGAELMDLVRNYGGLIGPAHAFTPWTSIYKEFDSIYDCYNNNTPDFLELGLSADTDMADRIEELQDIPFLSNSDSHSPWPHRMGREFNEIEIKEMTFNAFKDAIRSKKLVGNYGFDPRLGKYHETGCVRCYRPFTIEEAKGLKMRCPCGGLIKKGVKDRISDIAKWDEPHHPEFRPKYTHILPLAEVISLVYGKGITTVFVQKIWKELVQTFGSEIEVLIYAPLEEIAKGEPKLADVMKSFREHTLNIRPGAGGHYGEIVLD